MLQGAIALPMYPGSNSELRETTTLSQPENDDLEDETSLAVASENETEGARLLGSSSQNQNIRRHSRHRQRQGVGRTSAGISHASLRSYVLAGVFISVAALGFLVIPAFLPETTHHHTGMLPEHDVQLWNGTHHFRKTVIMISIDGLRNHWSILTGLHAESHGIVANDFYDPVSDSTFHYHDKDIVRKAYWWKGEPIWETASKAGLITANLMWLGPSETATGVSPTYFEPWKNHVPMQEKHDHIMSWVDLPFEQRPQLILGYEPHLDQVGHQAGPGSDLVNSVLRDVDRFAASIHSSIRARNLTDIVDLIFVSDHGMANTSNTRLVYLDDVMGKAHVAQIEHEEGWPSVGLRMRPETNTTDVLTRLLTSAPATSDPPAIDVYTAKTMPARYHFNPRNNQRIAPLYIVPRLGWAITNHHEHEVIMQGQYTPKGNHGYDNDEPSMHAMFVADGPFATLLKRRATDRLSPLRWIPQVIRKSIGGLERLAVTLNGSPEGRKNPQLIDTFPNTEIYGLIVKLLNLEKFAVPNNGTAGFWDRYLDEDD